MSVVWNSSSIVCVYQILDLLIEVFNKGGDGKLDVAVTADRTPELLRMSPYVTFLQPFYVHRVQLAVIYCENWNI